jgi:hypothetical protein
MSKKKPTAREAAKGRPCVVIDRDVRGNEVNYADPGVEVFSRSEHTPRDRLYHYSPKPIPPAWLDEAPGHRGDGSAANAWAEKLGEALARAHQQRSRRRSCP